MALLVVAEPPDAVRGLAARAARSPRASPRDADARARAATCSSARSCAMCHAIARHAGAGARVAPDLTHVGSRSTHRRRHAAQHAAATSRRWIADPQQHQARRQHAGRCRCRPDDLQRARSPTWRALKMTAPRRATPRSRVARRSRRRAGDAATRDLARPAGLRRLAPRDRPQDDRQALHRHGVRLLPRSAALLAALMRLQLARPENTLIGPGPATTRSSRCTARR